MSDISETSFSSEVFSPKGLQTIQCFSINQNANKVVVAGRDICKLYSIEDKFICKSELNFQNTIRTSSSVSIFSAVHIKDIVWSSLDESLVASCGTDGEIHKWKITQADMIVYENFTFKNKDRRTINKINFHPHEKDLLISGDQDGIINLIDFRTNNNPVSTFNIDKDEKVTDLQFNPLSEFQFAVGSENGHIYIWDIRNPTKFDRKFKPHMKGVYLDFHPEEKYWLATASKDKYIYIWDLSSSSPTPPSKYSLTHSDSISTIKWRPKRHTQIATCTTALGKSQLYIWDLCRPYVPYASFDKYQNFLWRNNPKVLLAYTSHNLFNISINDAIRPADHSTLVAVEINKYGSIAFAVGDVPPSEEVLKVQTANGQNNETTNNLTGSIKSTDQFINDLGTQLKSNLKFRINKSKMMIENRILDQESDWTIDAINGYKFKNDTFENLCEHNARLALNSNKISTYKNWMIIKTIFRNNTNGIIQDDRKNSNMPFFNEKSFGMLPRRDRRDSNDSINSDGFHEASNPENNEFSCEEYNIKNEEDDILLPHDIIEFNEEIDEYLNEKNSNQSSNEANNQNNNTDGLGGENQDANDLDSNYSKDFRLNILSKYHQPDSLKLNFDKQLKQLLFYYINEENDLPTAITMLLCVTGSGKYQKSNIEEDYLNEWFSQYIELLSKFEMWNLRVEIIKEHQSEFLKNLTLNSINYCTMCATCKKIITKGSQCFKCNKNPFLCSFCHLPVKDLFLWCHLCYHGGHLTHIKNWFKKHNTCPTGCGCSCWSCS